MTQYEAATPFMHGYRRPPGMKERLLAAVEAALEANPEMRLGQLVFTAALMSDGPDGTDPRNVWDENLIDGLNTWTEIGVATREVEARIRADKESKGMSAPSD